MVSLHGAAEARAQLDLELLPVSGADSSRVEFNQTFREEVSSLPPGLGEGCRRPDPYRVCPDLARISPNQSLRYTTYEIYVQERMASNSDRAVRFRFAAKALGRFLDHEEEVDLRVTAADGTATEGSLLLPIHSVASDDFLGFRLLQTPTVVPTGGQEVVSIDLTNLLTDLDVLVSGELRVSTNRPMLWQEPPQAELAPPLAAGEDFLLPRGDTAFGKIRLTAQPVGLSALRRSAVPYRRGSAPAGGGRSIGSKHGIHDRITVYVPYRTPGGFPRELAIELPIRFWPSGWSLLGALFAGVAFGSLFRLPWSRGRFGEWCWASLAALIVGVIGWAIALLLVAFDSEVRLFTIELDPYQILPVLVFGFAAGVAGEKAAAALKAMPVLSKIFPKADTLRPEEPEGKGAAEEPADRAETASRLEELLEEARRLEEILEAAPRGDAEEPAAEGKPRRENVAPPKPAPDRPRSAEARREEGSSGRPSSREPGSGEPSARETGGRDPDHETP